MTSLAAAARHSEQRRTRVKILNGPTMSCDAEGCPATAAFLFREEDGPITAFCRHHAGETALRAGVALPISKIAILHTAWS